VGFGSRKTDFRPAPKLFVTVSLLGAVERSKVGGLTCRMACLLLSPCVVGYPIRYVGHLRPTPFGGAALG
jgi:hypothetical protein